MARIEAQTRFELIDPALEGRGWNRRTDIRVVETAKPIDIVNHQPCERTRKPLASAGSYKINLVNLSSVQVPAAPIGQQAHTAAACQRDATSMQTLTGELAARLTAIEHLPAALLHEAFADRI